MLNRIIAALALAAAVVWRLSPPKRITPAIPITIITNIITTTIITANSPSVRTDSFER